MDLLLSCPYPKHLSQYQPSGSIRCSHFVNKLESLGLCLSVLFLVILSLKLPATNYLDSRHLWLGLTLHFPFSVFCEVSFGDFPALEAPSERQVCYKWNVGMSCVCTYQHKENNINVKCGHQYVDWWWTDDDDDDDNITIT